jgi:hypothetical protein
LEGDSKSLSIISEELSIEEEEKTPITLTNMKKGNHVIVNFETIELKAAAATPKFLKAAVI